MLSALRPMARPHETWRFGSRSLNWGERTYVMGILNVTPDSFSDGGRFDSLEAAIAHGHALVAEGADFIDIGGESTRPGAPPVPLETELARVIPVIRALRAATNVLISIDTYKPEVAEAAIAAGAHVVNDITGLQPAMLQVLAQHGVPGVAMHMQGDPRTMQQAPHYEDVVSEVKDYLAQALQRARALDVPILVDPGIGFGKTLEHNLALLRHLHDLTELGAPLLLGTSRKGLIGAVLDLPVTERVEGTMATVALGINQGVDVVRVHDVRAAVRTARMTDAVVRGHG